MISLKDGIHVDGRIKTVLDARSSDGEINFVSHAHSDHSPQKDSKVICSELTAKLCQERTGKEFITDSHNSIEMHKSGHIIGSRAGLIKGDEDVLYTGDVSTQDRLYLDGFQPVKADILIVESTYGIPAYTLPDQMQVVKQIKEWLESVEGPLFLFGYSLGRAQKINYIVQEFEEKEILVHEAVANMNRVIEKESNLEFRYKSYTDNKESIDEDTVVILPSRCSRSDWVEKLVKKTDGVKAGFSGWAAHESFKHRGNYDRTFALSDHCGFEDLVKLVKQVNPEKVYTHHGFDEDFASYLRRELGFNARSLKKNQSSLDEF